MINPIIYLCMLFAILFSSFTFPFQKGSSLKLNNAKKKGYSITTYGYVPNDAILVKDAIRPNEFLSNVFSKYSLGMDKAHEVSNFPKEVFNARIFKTGNKYAFVLKLKDGKLVPNQFIYEKNIIDYVVFDFGGEQISGEVKSKPITRKKTVSSAVIKGSLYQTLIDIDASPMLAMELADIYRWTIDFLQNSRKRLF